MTEADAQPAPDDESGVEPPSGCRIDGAAEGVSIERTGRIGLQWIFSLFVLLVELFAAGERDDMLPAVMLESGTELLSANLLDPLLLFDPLVVSADLGEKPAVVFINESVESSEESKSSSAVTCCEMVRGDVCGLAFPDRQMVLSFAIPVEDSGEIGRLGLLLYSADVAEAGRCFAPSLARAATIELALSAAASRAAREGDSGACGDFV